MIIFSTSSIISTERGHIKARIQQQETLTIPARWDNGVNIDLTNATITISGVELDSGGQRIFNGQCTGDNGFVEWQLSSGDVGRVSSYEIRVRAVGIDYDLESNPLLYTVLPGYDPEIERVVRHLVDGEPVYGVVALTETEKLAAINTQADDADAAIPAPLLRRVLAPLLPEEPDDEDAALYPAYRVEQSVIAGYVFHHEGILYRVVQNHTTAIQWVPGVGTESLYTRINNPAAPTPAWEPGSYALDAEVTHNQKTWRSRRNNNVWQPGTSDSGWMQIAPPPLTWYYLGGEGYPLDWELSHNGQMWRNTHTNNHWEPGVFGWAAL